jgi:hypothetical protein
MSQFVMFKPLWALHENSALYFFEFFNVQCFWGANSNSLVLSSMLGQL